jgi:hypothetical protein
VRIDPTGREYARWITKQTLPGDVVLEVAFNTLPGQWFPLTRVGPRVFTALVAGWLADAVASETIVLPVKTNNSTVRCVDYPEIAVRFAGTITVRA